MDNQITCVHQLNAIIESLKNIISNSNSYIPDKHKIVYVPKKVTKITYIVGRFCVTQYLNN